MTEPKIIDDVKTWLNKQFDIWGICYIAPKELIVSQEVYDNVNYYYDEVDSGKYGYRPVYGEDELFIKGIKLVVGEIGKL